MAGDWRQIPGNDHAYGRLRQVIARGEAIAFVGAGVSAGLYPLWTGLIRSLADEAVKQGLATDADRAYWLAPGTKPQQAVQGIKQALGQGAYPEALRQIFRPRASADGNYFTPVHDKLVRLTFRGIITTNYDLGLVDARSKLRPDIPTTGFATWKDQEEVYRWLNGTIFSEQPCPILFAHGVYQRSDTVVLSADEYRDAYKSGPYAARLFDKLWTDSRLVFIGFGFSDPWLDFLADSVITQTAARVTAAPQHVAIIGLRETEAYTPEQRRSFRDQYNADALFYPVPEAADRKEDHSTLLTILDALAHGTATTVAAPAAAPTPAAPAIPQRWVHETTEDERYVERPEVIERLDRWAMDETVRVMAVTGLGGLGKTSLIGYWLKRLDGIYRRPIKGLFFWSFYADRSVETFVKGLLQFAVDAFGEKPDSKLKSDDAALTLLKRVPLLLVLDGLEVLQERPSGAGTARNCASARQA